MRFVVVFLVCFIALMVVPVLWHGLSFNQLGFPFVYYERTIATSADGWMTHISISPHKLFYDLIITGLISGLYVFIKKKLKASHAE